MAGSSLCAIQAILIFALFHKNMAQDQPRVTAKLSVQPLWFPVIGNDTECHFEETNASLEMGYLYGSKHHTCSIQINAPVGYYTRMEILNSDMSNESFSLYIERQGDLKKCTNKYVVFNGNPHEMYFTSCECSVESTW